MPDFRPESIDSLLERARHVAGWTLGDLAEALQVDVPADFRHHKGWSGQLMELWLGASAGSRPEPDFPDLGVELKTLPIDSQGRPLESTYICVCPLDRVHGLRWQDSVVYHKLSRVLWIPIEGERAVPPAQRRIGMPLLWQPNDEELSVLRRDWEELMEQVVMGDVDKVTAHQGEWLQLRPKAANRRALTTAVGPDGNRVQTLPRGFYLRSKVTLALLQKHFF